MIFIVYLVIFILLLWKKEDANEYFEEKNCARLLRILNRDHHEFRRQRLGLIMITLILAFVVALKNKYISILIVFAAFKYPYLKINKEVKRLSEKVTYEFPIWLRQIQCLLQSNTVMNSMEESIERSPELMKSYLEDLVPKLKEDPSNYEYYQRFMESYDIWGIQNAMQHLYRYNFVNQSEAYQQLMILNESTTTWLKDGRAKKYKSYIDSHTYLAFLPMLSVTFLFFVLMALVMQGMFEGRWIA